MFAKDLIKSSTKPMFIMLSGVPCTGKSTWRELMLSKLKSHNIPVTVLSADDIAVQMCNEHNQCETISENKLTYTQVVTEQREQLELRFRAALLDARLQAGGIVILDRTYLRARWRKETLALIDANTVHAVTFDVMDKSSWQKNLSHRNALNPEKNITAEIIASLTNGASSPTIEEGFTSIIKCKAIGEADWEETFSHAITTLISHCTATETQLSDLHCHLNGSLSESFLKGRAEKNKCPELYEELIALRKNYLSKTQIQPEEGYDAHLMGLAWKQFGLIHQIVQSLDDITEATKDVIQHSAASYLEIRTTPKAMSNGSAAQYIDAFETGLVLAKAINGAKKAVGLLSLDRTVHTATDAEYLIQRVLSSSEQVLTGIDISGNPLGERTLTGKGLKDVVTLALAKGVAIAIHMAESDTETEIQDTDMALEALEEWVATQSIPSPTLLHGKVRLGHCIYLTELQKERIRALNVPIEVCPTCHMKLNWHLETKPHPVSSVYPGVDQPLVIGTDDEFIFGGSTKKDFSHFLRFFSNQKKWSEEEINAHQSMFRFSPHS